MYHNTHNTHNTQTHAQEVQTQKVLTMHNTTATHSGVYGAASASVAMAHHMHMIVHQLTRVLMGLKKRIEGEIKK